MLLFKNKIYEKGFFVVFEGLDGSGKTSQLNLLKNKLEEKEFEVVSLKEPSDTIWTEEIKKIAKFGRKADDNPFIEFEYFLKDRKHDVENNILPNLNNNKIILMDRYILSNFAYQSVLNIPQQDILDYNKIFPWPDLTIILQVPVKIGLERIRKNRGEEPNLGYEKEEFLEKVSKNFKNLNFPNLEYLDGQLEKEQLASEIYKLVNKYFKKKFDSNN